ncbi:hypothetical protein LCGC14_0391990 [marine sediment metagenome]|uniref:Uncharacterized protein n=1 Tax=marine sediment metagenome TaxID=412755 RepID=A0A0F9SZB7_9ZZZZ
MGCSASGGIDWPVVHAELSEAAAVARDFRALAGVGSEEYDALNKVVEYTEEARDVAGAVALGEDRKARVEALLKEGIRIATRLIDDISDPEKKRRAQLALIVLKMSLRRAGFRLE